MFVYVSMSCLCSVKKMLNFYFKTWQKETMIILSQLNSIIKFKNNSQMNEY